MSGWLLADTIKRADHCHGLVVRDGIEDACGKPPVAIVDGRETEDQGYWPACAWHANRYGPCVPLDAVLAALTTEGAEAALKLASEAINSVGGSHSHWREGGAGGVCRTCDDETRLRSELRDRLAAIAAGRAAGGGER